MGETKTSHVYDFGIFEPVTKPQNQLSVIFEDHKTPNKKEEENKHV